MTASIELWTGRDLEAAEVHPVCGGTAVVFTTRAPGSERTNEDSALLAVVDPGRGVLAVADGVGGRAAGEMASRTVVESLQEQLVAANPDDELRQLILSAIDRANESLIADGQGAASTVCLVELEGRRVRSYNVGDSLALVVGQRGKRKMQTISHSPVGYAVEAGLLSEQEAMVHEERHLVSVLVGERGTSLQMSAPMELASRDTLVLASDGLVDNLTMDEIVEIIRKGSLIEAASRLQAAAQQRMLEGQEQPCKPDDLTFILYRPDATA